MIHVRNDDQVVDDGGKIRNRKIYSFARCVGLFWVDFRNFPLRDQCFGHTCSRINTNIYVEGCFLTEFGKCLGAVDFWVDVAPVDHK